MHALSSCDTTGHTQLKGKKSWFNPFLKLPEDILIQLSTLGIGDIPTEQVLTACERYICQFFAPKATFTRANQLRYSFSLKSWNQIKVLKICCPLQEQRTEQHVFHAHLACNVWRQDPTLLELTDLGWKNEGKLKAILTKVPEDPEALVQLVCCNCEKSKCGGRCKCRRNYLICTGMCKCEADIEKCTNHNIVEVEHDEDLVI